MQAKTKSIYIALISIISILAVHSVAVAQSSISVTLHYLEATSDEKQIAYDVRAFLSVLDANDNPVKDLTLENFSISEDGEPYEVDSVTLTIDEPISIILVIDTSQSMKDQKIVDAKNAASAFIQRLGPDDQIAVVTFNNQPEIKIDFTKDHAAAQDHIRLIETVPFSGTCLYNALDHSVQMMSAMPSGRRSIIVLTDGVDETYDKKICSESTIDDVINLASNSTSRVPIYTIGLGNRIDETSLLRLAKQTGGRYLYSPASEKLDAQFQRLTDQLRSQYILQYRSSSSEGDHNVTVNVKYQQQQNYASRGFVLPGLPLHLTFISPTTGSTIRPPTTKIVVDVTGSPDTGESITNIVFEVNDEVVGSDDTYPYELNLNTTAFPAGVIELNAAAISESGEVLAETQPIILVILPPPTPTVTAVSVTETAPPPPPPPNYIQLSLICFGTLLAAIFVLTLLNYIRGKFAEKKITKSTDDLQMTYDDQWEEDKDALAVLTVINCDDFNTGYQKFNITETSTTLGRSTENDIPFPKEKPVSRYHAEIFEKNGDLYIKEIQTADENGNMISPRFGTFVDETKVSDDGLRLKSNSRIRLGKRLTLLVDIKSASDNEDVTNADTTLSDGQQTNSDRDLDSTNEGVLDLDRTNDDITNNGKDVNATVDEDDPDKTNTISAFDNKNRAVGSIKRTDHTATDIDNTNKEYPDPDKTNEVISGNNGEANSSTDEDDQDRTNTLNSFDDRKK